MRQHVKFADHYFQTLSFHVLGLRVLVVLHLLQVAVAVVAVCAKYVKCSFLLLVGLAQLEALLVDKLEQ